MSQLVIREEFGEELARVMEPDAWAEYDAGSGRCSNQSGWKILRAMEHAKAVLDLLADKGPITVPRSIYEDNPC